MTPELEPIPRAWLVMGYSKANGWPKAPHGEMFDSREAADAAAERRARDHPGATFVIFAAVDARRCPPNDPIPVPLT